MVKELYPKGKAGVESCCFLFSFNKSLPQTFLPMKHMSENSSEATANNSFMIHIRS